jgi:hypothetical protein
MDEVRKPYRVLNEEDRHVVADQIPDALIRIKLDGEASDVARRISRFARPGDGREANEDWGLVRGITK